MVYEVYKWTDGTYSVWSTRVKKFIAHGIPNPHGVAQFMLEQSPNSKQPRDAFYKYWLEIAEAIPVSPDWVRRKMMNEGETVTRTQEFSIEHYQDRIEYIANEILDNLSSQYADTCPRRPIEKHSQCVGYYSFLKDHLMRFVILNIDWTWVPEILVFNEPLRTELRAATDAISDLKTWTRDEVDSTVEDPGFSDIENIEQRSRQYRDAFLSEFLTNLANQYPKLARIFL